MVRLLEPSAPPIRSQRVRGAFSHASDHVFLSSHKLSRCEGTQGGEQRYGSAFRSRHDFAEPSIWMMVIAGGETESVGIDVLFARAKLQCPEKRIVDRRIAPSIACAQECVGDRGIGEDLTVTKLPSWRQRNSPQSIGSATGRNPLQEVSLLSYSSTKKPGCPTSIVVRLAYVT